MQTNLAMMRNLMDPLLERAAGLRHVSVLQGTKAYGAHVHRLNGSGPRGPGRAIRTRTSTGCRRTTSAAAAPARRGRFTIWRPQVVFGGALGVAMNLIPIIGVYGAICRELGRPFTCPGEHGHVIEAVDADLIARALAWAAEAPAAADQTFNITNGDVFVWENVWPAIADALGLEPAFGRAGAALRVPAPRTPRSGTGSCAKHGLDAPPMAELVGQSHHYADFLFAWGAQGPIAPALVSTIKLRQAGFGDCVDTEAMFRRHLARLAERRVLPAP